MFWLKKQLPAHSEEEIKETVMIERKNKSRKHSRPKRNGDKEMSSEDSFDLKENENEFYGKKQKKTPSRNARKASKFELEMNKYGLLENIKEIKKLNFYLGAELGSTLNNEDNFLYDNPRLRNQYEFPFQRRARSISPPRGTVPFRKNKEVSNTSKPVTVKENFFINAFNKKYYKKPISSLEIEEAMIDSFGLSTGPSYEAKKETQGDDLIYQKIIGPIKKLSKDINIM